MRTLCIILLGLCMLFPIAASIYDWDFFFEHRKVRTIVNIFGRKGARIFYIVVCAFIEFCIIATIF